MKTIPALTPEDAAAMMKAAEVKAMEIGVDMDIAITDANGSLIMFHRMENGKIASIDIAINKAYTAAAQRKSTRAYGESSQPGGPTYGIESCIQGRFTIFAGGLPIFAEEQIVGAIGCSSGTPDQDEIVAQAGIEALMASL